MLLTCLRAADGTLELPCAEDHDMARLPTDRPRCRLQWLVSVFSSILISIMKTPVLSPQYRLGELVSILSSLRSLIRKSDRRLRRNGATDVVSWEILTGSHPSILRPTAHAKKDGFETEIAVPSAQYVRARAYNGASHSHVLIPILVRC